jgi:hypothetical protein
VKRRHLCFEISLTLILLLGVACSALQRPAPSGRLTSPLVAPTPTPARARLTVLQVTRAPSVTVEQFSTTPVGETFLVVTATLANTGNTALQPALLNLTLEDAAGHNFPRAQEAEFILRTAERPVLPDRPIPPGTTVQALLVFDVTTVELPVRLLAHLPEQTLYSAWRGAAE